MIRDRVRSGPALVVPALRGHGRWYGHGRGSPADRRVADDVTMRVPIYLLAVILAATGCGSNEPGRPVADVDPSPSPTEIVLVVGQEVRVDSVLRLGFMGVPQDTRCPTTVVCPWEGDGEAEIAYGLGMGPSYPDTLHTTLEPKSVLFGGYEITLVDLMPYPYTSDAIPLDEYAARFRVERIER